MYVCSVQMPDEFLKFDVLFVYLHLYVENYCVALCKYITLISL